MFNIKSFFDNIKTGIILIYGAAATGKTTICLQQSLEISKKGKVLFLDTEDGFSIERITQMGGKNNQYLNNILIIKPRSFEELNKKVELFEKYHNKFDAIFLDSFGIFYRLDLQNKGYIKTNNTAVNILRRLRHISKNIPVIITNQIYETNEGKRGLGGNMIQNFSDYILELEDDPRKVKMKKPKEKETLFKITNNGVITSSSRHHPSSSSRHPSLN